MEQSNSSYEGPAYPVYSGPVSAGLAKRLGNAADSLRDGKYHFIVAELDYPHRSQCTIGFATIEAASQAANEILDGLPESIRDNYKKFGPYQSGEEQGYYPYGDYDKLEIRFINTSNPSAPDTKVIQLDKNDGADAVVFSLAAFDKFFLPYYSRLYGAEVANDMRNDAKNILSGQSFEKSDYQVRALFHRLCSSASLQPFGNIGS